MYKQFEDKIKKIFIILSTNCLYINDFWHFLNRRLLLLCRVILIITLNINQNGLQLESPAKGDDKTLAPAHTPCLFSIDLHTVRQHMVIVHFLLLLLLSGTLFQMMSGVPHLSHHLSLV